MPDRPTGPPDRSSGTSPDEPEFHWLYGGPDEPDGRAQAPRRGPSAAPGDPEPTQMLPTQPRDRGEDRPVAPPQGRPRTPRASTAPPVLPSAQPQEKSRRHRGFPVRRVVLSVLALWLVFLLAVPLWAWSRIDKVDADPSGSRPADQPGTTYLLVGSDSRAGLSAEQRKRLGTGDAAGKRTDTIMLLHVGSGPNLLLSIPRDSLVRVPGHGTTKINAAYAYGGPKLLVQTLEQDTGVRIDDYVEIGMGGVVNAVDAVGGVRICTKKKLDDKLANLHLTKGCHLANGAVALAFSRSRHSQQLGDIDRAKNQREIVSQVGGKVKSPMTVINPFRYLAVAKAGSGSLRISRGTGPVSLLRFAWAMSHVNGANGLTCSMPITDLAVHWDRQRALALFARIKADQTASITHQLCTPTGLPG